MQQPLRTVDIERRGYGRRYTWLPVDSRDREGFTIDFTGAYIRPEQIDIQVDDIVRWHEDGRVIQAYVSVVQRGINTLDVRLRDTQLLPPEAFYP